LLGIDSLYDPDHHGATCCGVVLGGFAAMTYLRLGHAVADWLTSIDHKKIGIMYCILAW
jgi:cytochrome o ubiquinol oxidase subunit 1